MKIERRDVDGILLLDKPSGLTSNRALQVAKRLFAARKAGHTGSLDPLATGLLPLCFGEATKVSSFLLDADKGYRVQCRLGTATATGDSDGEVVETAPVPALTAADVESALAGFVGRINQTPPMYSALKHEGKRLYELAREGKSVERKPREIEIYALRLIELSGDTIEYDVRCSKGTYVRTLSEDIARALGTLGHVSALRRYKVGAFEEAGMVTLDELEQDADAEPDRLDARLTPIDAALTHWPAVELNGDSAYYLRRGQAVFVAGAPETGWLRIYGPNRSFLGLGAMDSSGKVAPKRLIRAK
ncbi:MAG TPA: tRNA pseudouridine(55) synthase TruB [Gammaproteobacteria bacterium]|nr:tRNA pseudouridine(55) synthase TruB [Gammaproteobacteria bacterium]